MSARRLQLEGLKECIGQQNPDRAKRYFKDHIESFFEQDLSKPELDLGLDILFDEDVGTIACLKRTLKERKAFKDLNTLIFELWIKLIKNENLKGMFLNYADLITQICLQYITSTSTSAKEKEKSTQVLQEIFLQEMLTEINVTDLLSSLLQIFNVKGAPATFLKEIFRLFGIISKTSPEEISDQNALLIRNNFLKTLEFVTVNEEAIHFDSLAGAMEGLNMFLMNFASSKTDEPMVCQRLYSCVKKLSEPHQFSRKKLFHATLDVFTNHSSLFSEEIYKDFNYWHDCLSKWLSMSSIQDRRKGIFATHTFHRVISEHISLLENSENDKRILMFFINKFKTILESSGSQSFEIRIAIRGFGLMAKPCKIILPAMLQELISLVIQRSELIALAEDNELREYLEHFPDYIEALAQIIVAVKDKHATQLLSQNIQSIAIRLIRDFHYLSAVHTILVVNSLREAFFNLSEIDGSILDDILRKIVLQGVIWTCSHKLTFDANWDWGNVDVDWKENVTFKSYLPLWNGLLLDYVRYGSLVARKLFDHLMSTLFTIIGKLNLNIKRRVISDDQGNDQEFYFCDPNIDLCPERPKDFHIFFNLVDFYRELLINKFDREYFHKWINEYCSRFIDLATKHPLVSGFLKLLERGLVLATSMNCFDSDDGPFESLQIKISYFLKNLIVKCQRVSGELQIACLELILKFPSKFYREYLIHLIPIFEIALIEGKSTTWLAKLAIGGLEKIDKRFKINELNFFYQQVLPHLDSYMQSKSSMESSGSDALKKKRSKKGISLVEKSDLQVVQNRILTFLGKIDPQHAVLIVAAKQNDDLVKWDAEQKIKLKLHVPDLQPIIYFDALMPRICQLAVTSGDRKTKIAACELVHAIVLYLLGTRQTKGNMWRELATRILILGADSDSTVQEMFEPLLQQIMHYMSKYENLDYGVDILLDALMQAISAKDNCALRDVGAVCFREFVQWSIKQTTPAQLAASPVSIEIMLNQLKMYSLDSDGAKRNGAALAFNNLYRILREEESICDIFFVDLLHIFCLNFKLTEELSTATMAELDSELEQVSMSLNHIVRVLKERNYLFYNTKPNRKLPIGFKSGNMEEIVLFLFKEAASKLMNYRHKCIEMVEILAARIENISSFSSFLQKYADAEALGVICEGKVFGVGITARPNLEHLKNCPGTEIPALYSWLEHFLSSIDCYCWLLNENALLHPTVLFDNAQIFNVISYYLKNMCKNGVLDILQSVIADILDQATANELQMHTEQLSRISMIKCTIIVRIIDFLSKVLRAGCSDRIPSEFFPQCGNSLNEVIIDLIFEPQLLDFDFKSKEVAKKLPQRIEQFLKDFKRYIPTHTFIMELQKKIRSLLINNLKRITDDAQELLSAETVTDPQKNMVRGIMFCAQNLKVLDADAITISFVRISAKKLFGDLFYGLKEDAINNQRTVEPPPDVKKLANDLIKLCFVLENVAGLAVDYILDAKLLDFRGMFAKIEHGEHFLSVYKWTLFEMFSGSFIKSFLSTIFEKLTEQTFHRIAKVLSEFLEFMFKYCQRDENVRKIAIDMILSRIVKLLVCLADKDDDLLFIEILSHMAMISPYPLSVFKEKAPNIQSWILERLKNETITLEDKSRTILLLPLIIGPEEKENIEVMSALEKFQCQHLPLKSTEFRPNSLEETGLKSAFKCILDTLVSTKSGVVLNFIIKITACDEKHILEWLIREKLKVFFSKITSEQQLRCLDNIFQMIQNVDYEPTMRLNIFERFLVKMLQSSCEETLIEFYSSKIRAINVLADTNFGFASHGWLVEQALVSRIFGFRLIELMCGCLPKEKLMGIECSILKAFMGDQPIKHGRELIGKLTEKSFYARSNVFVTEDSIAAELFRKYQCAAFCAVCALVSNTQTTLVFYYKFIFEEDSTKNFFVWRKLIDCRNDQLYQFAGQEHEKYPKRKERFVSIRKLNTDHVVLGRRVLPKHLQTQNVFESSLSQDVSNLDLNYSLVRTDAEAALNRQKIQQHNVSVELVQHSVNKHEVMDTLCGVIRHMFENQITSVSDDPTKRRTHDWVTAIGRTIANNENHKNVRIFLSQLLDNCRDIFQHYSHSLFGPILEMLVDECAGTSLNSFITDQTVLILSWSAKGLYKPTTTEEIRNASALLRFYIKNCFHDNREIYKLNLEFIQTMISLWRNEIIIPHKLLLELITRTTNPDSRDNGNGIVIMGIVLANDLKAWPESSKLVYLQSVYSNLNNQYTSVYQPAAHVIGMMLKQLKEDDDKDNLEVLIEKITQNLRSYSNKNDKKFLDILFNVQKGYPPIIDVFKEIIAYKVVQAVGKIKRIYLEMMLSRIESYAQTGIFNVLISIGIKDLLKIPEYQLLAVHLLNRSIPLMIPTELETVLEIIEQFIDSTTSSECRDVAYEICIYLAMNHKQILGGKPNFMLLKGLSDRETNIQNRIFQYWSQEASLPQNLDGMFIALISDFSGNCDRQFLTFCTQLLLQPAIESREAKEQIFAFETDRDAKLSEYKISVHSKVRSSYTLPPLFAETQQARQSLLTGTQLCNFVRATGAEYFFEPTQDHRKLTQSQNQFTLPQQSSLPFIIKPQVLDRRSRQVEGEQLPQQQQKDPAEKSIEHLRKIFVRDVANQQRNKVLKVIDNREQQKGKIQAEIKRRENEVTLYRRYRFGDYPDLLINSLALLLPLQGLAKRDEVTARQVFVSIFTAVYNALGVESRAFVTSIGDKVQTLLETSKTCESIVFAAFLEIALLKPEYFNVNPKIIGEIAKRSNMLTIGAVYLENRIIADWSSEELSSRSSHSLTMDAAHWAKLADIYNSLAEYDIVASIFTDKIRTDPRLGDAIELKSNGKYEMAQQKLIAVIGREIYIEQYYAYQCYYECFLEMGMWPQLSRAVQSQINDLEELWSDDYNKSFLLPNLMQSELHNVLEGETLSQDFLLVLENWTRDPIKAELINSKFCEEIMMHQIANKEFLTARVYAEKYLKTFLSEWGVISCLNGKLRMKTILNAQKVAEIDQYAQMFAENFNVDFFASFVSKWDECRINSSDSLVFWNNVIAYRFFVAALGLYMLRDEENDIRNTVQETLVKMNLQFFDAAVKQNNYPLVEKSFTRMFNENDWQYQLMKVNKKLMQGMHAVGENRIEILEQAWIYTGEILERENDIRNHDLQLQALDLGAEIGEKIFNELSHIEISPSLNARLIPLTNRSSAEQLQQRVFDQTLWFLQKSSDFSDTVLNDSSSDISIGTSKNVANSFYRLAQFCYDYYRNERIHDDPAIVRVFIRSIFQAMNFNSKEAQKLFPCILQLCSSGNSDFEIWFQTFSAETPEWMFLQWIPQIFSRLSFEEPSYLDDILLKIAKIYHNALVYPFHVWLHKHTKYQRENAQLRLKIYEIKHFVTAPLKQKFIQNLATLCFPEMFLLTHFEDFLRFFKKTQNITQEIFQKAVSVTIFETYGRNSENHGSMFRRIQKYRESLQELQTLNFGTDYSIIQKKIDQLHSKIRSQLAAHNEQEILLENLCPWLAAFYWCGEEAEIEIPGQYTGEKRPDVANHVKIVKFGNKMKVYNSQKRPIRMKLYGSDAKSYDFLVKFGEDLKQDQRIQQLLELMSNKMQEDKNCRNHNLLIRTYKVIPIEENCGILSMVGDTISLLDLVLQCIERRTGNGREILQDSVIKYQQFIEEASRDSTDHNDMKLYGNAVVKYTREQIINNFRSLENVVHVEIIKYALADMAVSPESFFVLRNNFATSLAAMNIAHWILGIGDRHLENVLASTKDGSLTGIDFGFAFGTGIRNSPVPELIPFRLTPHLVNAMSPMGTSGWIFKCMTHALRVFRASEKVLVACMDIFIQEPTVNWLSAIHEENLDDSSSDRSSYWGPSDRINVAKLKLQGHNPMNLIEKELRVSMITSIPRYLTGYTKILSGNYQFNIRAQLPVENLSVEGQVKCLIDLATDPAILGISYKGLLPWI